MGKRQGCLSGANPHLGWSVFTEYTFPSSEKAPGCLFGAVCDCSLKPRTPQLTLCFFAQLVKRRHFQAKSDFSSLENTFGLGFKQVKPSAHNQGTGKFGQILGSFALILGGAYLGKSKCSFVEQTCIGAHLHSLSRT